MKREIQGDRNEIVCTAVERERRQIARYYRQKIDIYLNVYKEIDRLTEKEIEREIDRE